MARLSNSDLGKIPGITLKGDTSAAPSLDDMKATVRNCYLVIAFNTIWLLIPLFGVLTGNVIAYIFQVLIVAGLVLFISNNYLAKRWYYVSDFAKDTAYEKHFANIDDIGYRTFFVTMISSLVFLILAVLVTNAKSSFGQVLFQILDFALCALMIALAVWILKRVSVGLTLSAKGQAYA